MVRNEKEAEYMKVVFVSNYYNHHQSSFSAEMIRLTNGNYFFIENEPLSEERKKMGWGEKNIPSYVKQAYTSIQSRKECVELINSADFVLYENTTKPLVLERLNAGKLTYLYSERLFKQGYEYWKIPIRWFTWHKLFDKYKNHYLLCASAYTSADFALELCFRDRAYKWGYFPHFENVEIESILENKNDTTLRILSVSRLIDWKHPEISIKVAKQLADSGVKFQLDIIGNGPLEENLKNMIDEYSLEEDVCLRGPMKPDEVRKYMKKADIYLFTSDFNEGWGAVLNEAMNSGCAIVASHAIGAVPYLLKDGENGLIYQNDNFDDLMNKVKKLVESKELRRLLGKNAFNSIKYTWNAEVAAQRLIELSKDIIEKGVSNRFNFGPCSKAERLANNWYGK